MKPIYERRRFPTLYDAKRLYGDRIFYSPPNYVRPKHCRWCNKELKGRRTSFCSDECARIYNQITVWYRNRDPYFLRILYRDNFTCQKCGEFHAFHNEHGVYISTDDGNLNVHHIVPVSMGGGDEPENLMTVCIKCHKRLHSNKKEDENG